MEFEILYPVLIQKGPPWTPEETPEVERLQAEHLADINRLHELRLLVAAASG